MGVPKFYRWISERYPCLSETVKEHEVPEFDNLYLDMNGIIHICSHPNDDDPHFRITEEQIFKNIFHYIDVLFRIVRPQKVFFMAVDGVAPRAKMNQQRGRRFRTIKEAELTIKKALQKGETLPTEKRFDHNCITPGTKFMIELQKQLEYFVHSKITSDPLWQGLRVYLSGHETPGEGEHKIMEFIRHERSHERYDANTRHCLYGLDADLMMLGLCSHEPHFSLLREEVRFGKQHNSSRTAKAEETNFHLLHLSLMREYIDHEFEELKKMLSFPYNLESIIDDWVLMGFLVGNDFIPHLPNLHIAHNALPYLYQSYIQVLPQLDGYINEGGIINLQRFQKYLDQIAVFDLNKFEESYADFRWMESKKTARKLKQMAPNETDESSDMLSSDLEIDVTRQHSDSSLQAVKELARRQGILSPESSETDSVDYQDDTTFQSEFLHNKRSYYCDKLHLKGTDEDIATVSAEYVRAMQWICHYYYNGVQSWSWFYPYHYSPYISDIRNCVQADMNFSMDAPFLPYEQLLAVLPSASKECLPDVYWSLMCDKNSPIADFYPQDFECDLNGKQQEWEAVVLIPFIDEVRLLSAMANGNARLVGDDRKYNRHTGCLLYKHQEGHSAYYNSRLPGVFPDIPHSSAICTQVPLHAWQSSDVSVFKKGLLKGTKLSVFFPGFPTLHHIPHTAKLMKQGVKVFQMPSRNNNLILRIAENNQKPSLSSIAQEYLGSSVHVRWPHLVEAKVVAVSDGRTKHQVDDDSLGKTKNSRLYADENVSFNAEIDAIKEHLLLRKGIDVGEVNVLIYAKVLLGKQYTLSTQNHQELSLVKEWAVKPLPFPIQAVVKDLPVQESLLQAETIPLEEHFKLNSIVYKVTAPNYGSKGRIVGFKRGIARIQFFIQPEPNILNVNKKNKESTKYYFGYQIAAKLGLSGFLVSRITGKMTLPFEGKAWKVGLSTKQRDSAIEGYTKYDKGWMYSSEVLRILMKYNERFPTVLPYVQRCLENQSKIDAWKMFDSDNPLKKLEELQKWVSSLGIEKQPKISINSQSLDSSVIQAIDEEIQAIKDVPGKTVTVDVRPNTLYKPVSQSSSVVPDANAKHRLLDRVVIVRESYSVPLDMHGTIISIHQGNNMDKEPMYEVLFDKEFASGSSLGGKCPELRGFCIPSCAFINLTEGKRLENNNQNYRQSCSNRYAENNDKMQRSSPNYTRRGGLFQPHPRSAFNRFNQAKQQSAIQYRAPEPMKLMTRRTAPRMITPRSANIFDSVWSSLRDHDNSASVSSKSSETSPARKLDFQPNSHQEGILKTNKTVSDSHQDVTNHTTTTENNSTDIMSLLSQAAKTLPKGPQQKPTPKMKVDLEDFKVKAAKTEVTQEPPDVNVLNKLFKSVKIGKDHSQNSVPNTNYANETNIQSSKSLPVSLLFESVKKSPSRFQNGGVPNLIGNSFSKEGTRQLSELLTSEQLQDEKRNADEWSTEQDKDEEITVEVEEKTVKEDAVTNEEAVNSDKDDDIERSSSVEDNKPRHSKVEELMTECKKHNMMPPIYSYYTTPEKQIVSTVQLMNGLRFNAPPKPTCDSGMETAASSALAYLKSKQSSISKDSLPYSQTPYLNNAAFPQYGIQYVPPQHQQMYLTPPQVAMLPPTRTGSYPASYHPSVLPHYGMLSAPEMLQYYPPQSVRHMNQRPYYLPPQPITYGAHPPSFLMHNSQRLPQSPVMFSQSPKAFIPLQVAKQQVSSPTLNKAPPGTTTTAEAVKTDSNNGKMASVAVSSSATTNTSNITKIIRSPNATVSMQKRTRAKLAASFNNVN